MRYPKSDVGANNTNTNPNVAGGQNLKIINNIMHINHSGANINIMCGNSDKQSA